MQIIIEDKENRRDIVNRQSANGGIPTITNNQVTTLTSTLHRDQ